jgi:hypothetical protein
VARVVGYGPFSLWVIQKESLCPSSGGINRLMMIIDLGVFYCKVAEIMLRQGTFVLHPVYTFLLMLLLVLYDFSYL